MGTAETVAEGSAWVCRVVEGRKEGWGRGQALELTDLEDYIKTTQLPIIWKREEATETWRYVFKEKILTTGFGHFLQDNKL